jgi:spatacsin
MVAEWKEFLWDVPEERIALWGHCQTLFIRYSFPALQAGLFFLRHAEVVEKDLPAREIYELLLLSLQWLSGLTTLSHPVYPLHLLREIETRVWLLAVEAESHVKNVGAFSPSSIGKDMVNGYSSNLIDRTASIITKMDSHISSATKNRIGEKHDARAAGQGNQRNQDTSTSIFGASTKPKRRAKGNVPQIRHFVDSSDRNTDFEDSSSLINIKSEFQLQEESTGLEISLSKWEESIEPAELERAVLSLLEFGQVTAAKQLQLKLAPGNLPSELIILDAVMKLAMLSTPCRQVLLSMLDDEVRSVIQSHSLKIDQPMIEPLQILENLSTILNEGSGRGLARKIIAVIKAANILGLTFTEAYQKQPIELLRLLSLKAQDSFEEACLLVQTHSMPAASIAQILAESFLKGLLAAHRGGYIDSQKEEGPAPLLWRFSDFLKWAELCPSEQEIGHALMRLVITGQEIPHACEVELLILSHHFYKSSTCLDGVDVLVALAATRVEAYVAEGDFSCLARLITGVGNFHALNFILNILIENGQLDLLLQKFSAAADANTGTAQAVRSFRMAVLTSLNLYNPNDHDAFAMVCMSLVAGISQVKEFISSCFVCLPQVHLRLTLTASITCEREGTFWVVFLKVFLFMAFFMRHAFSAGI